jgi:hypothetical protein
MQLTSSRRRISIVVEQDAAWQDAAGNLAERADGLGWAVLVITSPDLAAYAAALRAFAPVMATVAFDD